MKTLTSIFMILAVVAGLVLALTPFIADKFFPVPENTVRQAKPEAAAMALKRWFNEPDAQFVAVQAINKSTEAGTTAWFTFSVGRAPIEKYIIEKRLQQKDINGDILKAVFFTKNSPATWWQPTAINQETYFTGKDQGRTVSLIYNPVSKRGVLVTATPK
ncbi:MAG: hypothetical protein V3V19_08180 [Cocleimonas sp.]